METLAATAPIAQARRFKKHVAVDAGMCVACVRCVEVCPNQASRMAVVPSSGASSLAHDPRQLGIPDATLAHDGVLLIIDDALCDRCRACELACLTGACQVVEIPAER